MERRRREDMIATTRAKLITAGREAFAAKGYAETSLEELTSVADLTRGALYHHFGGKKGLLEAVIAQIDTETAVRLKAAVENAPSLWEGFVDENILWVQMALDPEVRRIVLLDGPAVLGNPTGWASQNACLADTQYNLEELIANRVVKPVDPEATAYLVNGAALNAALWIASSSEPIAASKRAIKSFRALLDGLRLIT